MVLETSSQYAENTHCLGRTQDPVYMEQSRRNSDWTSGGISCRTISWHPWNWNWNSISESCRKNILGDDMPRKESLCGWIAYSESRIQSGQFGISYVTINCRRCTLLHTIEAIQHWGNSCRTESKIRQIQCATRKALYFSKKRSGQISCLSIFQRRGRFQPRFRNLWWEWFAVMIKMSEIPMEQFIGIR